MTDSRESGISALERHGLTLVYAGPVSVWVWMARAVGVKVDPEAVVDERLLSDAESGARVAARWFTAGLIATAVCIAALAAWSPVQASLLDACIHVGFHELVDEALAVGLSFSAAIACAGAATMLTGLLVGLLNALVFGGVPLFLLRNSTAAAAPAVSVAIAHRGGSFDNVPSAYPRVALAVDRILDTRIRPLWRRP